MKKLFYYTTAALSISCGISQAQTCVPTPDCQTLGYTSSSYCSGGIKCPFGNYWNCDAVNCELSGKMTELTEKIAELEEKIGTSSYVPEACMIGSILFSDKSCSRVLQLGKTPIGVVVYLTEDLKHGQALALKSAGNYEWGVDGTIGATEDISGLTNYSSASSASQDFASCENSAKIRAHGDKSIHPAVWAAHEYSTEGTEAGDWCLPAAGIFTSYYNNRDLIDTAFTLANGTQFTDSTEAWSSSEYSSNRAWRSYFTKSYGLDYGSNFDYYHSYDKSYSYPVYPVIKF